MAIPKRAYDSVAMSLHWLIAGLVLVQFVTKLLPAAPHSPEEARLNAWHLAIGPTILLLMLGRLVWRLTHTPPPPPDDLVKPLALLSRATHWAFYALLIAQPVLGWLSASAYGAPASILGLIGLPMIAAKSDAAAERWGDLHGTLGWLILALIGLHIAGALYHALVKQDGVLGRMLPGGVPDRPDV